ncbi:MAG: MFS transporter [Candidatus Verstraetearchaeota archaeon]|nr:MFS transporter [Candidatus Verstraetearchaeota archaeon]
MAHKPWLKHVGLALLIVTYFFVMFLRFIVGPLASSSSFMCDLHVTAAHTGLIASTYFLAYAAMLIPSGVIIDKRGPFQSILLAAVLTLAGYAIFTSATSLTQAIAGMAIAGMATPFFYISAVKVISAWFPEERFATLTGLTLSVGYAGASASLAAFPLLFSYFETWRTPIAVFSIILFAVALTAVIVLRGLKVPRVAEAVQAVRSAFTRSNVLIGLVGFALIGVLTGAAQWAPKLSVDILAVPKAQAGIVASMVMLGTAMGRVSVGYLADRVKRHELLLFAATIAATVLTTAMAITISIISAPLFSAALLALGLLTGAQSIVYALAAMHAPKECVGTSASLVDGLSSAGAFAYPWLMGFLMDLYPYSLVNGIPVYPVQSYTLAFASMAVGLALASVISLFLLKALKK